MEAEVLRQQKDESVNGLQADGCAVALAGAGLNGTPGMAQAHVGIAMGTGTDVAMECAESS